MRLNTYSWGHGGGSPIVCVHGVTGHAGVFRKLAEDTLADRPVLAMDLRGHGRSGWLPPWNLETHVADLAETAQVHAVEHATWIGFGFGGCLVAELALHDPRLVDRLVLLEPVLHLPPQVGLEAAERERHEETYAAADEAVAAWGEMPAASAAAGVPTLIVVGTESWVPIEEHLERYRAVLGAYRASLRVIAVTKRQRWLPGHRGPGRGRSSLPA